MHECGVSGWQGFILKVVNNWLTAFQLNESKDPQRRASKE